MPLNITLEVYLTIVSIVITIISAFLIFRQYRSEPDRALFAMFLAWSSFAIWQSFNVISYITLDLRPFLVKNVFIAGMAISANVALSLMDRGEIKRFDLAAVSFASAFGIMAAFFDNPAEITTYERTGEQTIAHLGFNRFMTFLLFFYVVIAYTFYAVKILRNAPPKIRRDARIFLTGIVIFGFLGLITFGSGLSGEIPGITDLVIATGILVSSIGLTRTPQLLYVLPFQAIRLSVIQTDSGLNFYSYRWNRNGEYISDDLFSASLVALSAFMRDGVGHGTIQEVKLEGASLIVNSPSDQGVFYIILATKPSYTLRRGLIKFSNLFHEHLSQYIKRGITTEVTQFQRAEEFIPTCFPYIPSDQ